MFIVFLFYAYTFVFKLYFIELSGLDINDGGATITAGPWFNKSSKLTSWHSRDKESINQGGKKNEWRLEIDSICFVSVMEDFIVDLSWTFYFILFELD